jgi:hypothetical protein
MLDATQNVNLFPSINGYFSDERRSPRVSALLSRHSPFLRATADAAPAKMSGISHLIYKLNVLNLLIEKISHL